MGRLRTLRSMKLADWSLPSYPRAPVSRCRIPQQKLSVGQPQGCLIRCLATPQIDCPNHDQFASRLLVGCSAFGDQLRPKVEDRCRVIRAPSMHGENQATGSSEEEKVMHKRFDRRCWLVIVGLAAVILTRPAGTQDTKYVPDGLWSQLMIAGPECLTPKDEWEPDDGDSACVTP